jgi:hypothetical protein
VDDNEENEFQDEVNLGGMSQTMLDLCEKVDCHEEKDVQDEGLDNAMVRGENRAVAMKTLHDAPLHEQGPKSASKIGANVSISSPRKESLGGTGLSSNSDIEVASAASAAATQNRSLHGASKQKAVVDFSAETSDTQQINAIETQSPIDRSSITIPRLKGQSSCKLGPHNIGIVGKTSKGIRNGDAGRTTFSALDLPRPQRKEKKKKDPV